MKFARVLILALIIGGFSTVYCQASNVAATAVPGVEATTKGSSKADSKNDDSKAAEGGTKENRIPQRSIEELSKELAEIKQRNDELHDKVSKSNAQIIEVLKQLKSRKGITRRQIRLFNKNEAAIGMKLDILSKAIESLKDTTDKLVVNEKILAELLKTDSSSTSDKAADTGRQTSDRAADVKQTAAEKAADKAADGKQVAADAVAPSPEEQQRAVLELNIALQTDRNKILSQIFVTLDDINSLLP